LSSTTCSSPAGGTEVWASSMPQHHEGRVPLLLNKTKRVVVSLQSCLWADDFLKRK
jgi:hypothetical protein